MFLVERFVALWHQEANSFSLVSSLTWVSSLPRGSRDAIHSSLSLLSWRTRGSLQAALTWKRTCAHAICLCVLDCFLAKLRGSCLGKVYESTPFCFWSEKTIIPGKTRQMIFSSLINLVSSNFSDWTLLIKRLFSKGLCEDNVLSTLPWTN